MTRGTCIVIVVVAIAISATQGAAAQQSESSSGVATRTIYVRHVHDQEGPTQLVDRLAPETLLTVTATGFPSDTSGSISQCVQLQTVRCTNRIPVRFDDAGAATFQYFITDELGGSTDPASRCRLQDPQCNIRLVVGDTISILDTVFVDKAPPPGRMQVTPRRDLRWGDEVTVDLTGFPPNTPLQVTMCAAPAISGPRCGPPAPVLHVTTNLTGTGQGSLRIDVDAVGSDQIACGRGIACRLVVSSTQIGIRAQPVTLTFQAAPGAGYDTARVSTGIAIAALLVGLAAWLTHTTDWDPPTEADGTAIDTADYADLDLEIERYESARNTFSDPP